jgi:hypothetical protein
MPHNPSATSAVTPFGPVANPRGNVIRLHRPTTIELSYARQGKAFRPNPIDLRVNQLKLRVHPPIPAWQVIVMLVVAAAIGFWLAVGAS